MVMVHEHILLLVTTLRRMLDLLAEDEPDQLGIHVLASLKILAR
jgi:hypothetical protein